ncbi:unnamed protein product [Adineta ricciae]|uniref:SCP domain-containing protein n=1 Tax=Adineta ricciae TaxID=249248 RepID=A0A815RMC6_ADIRI|nr:unnamed protein product [Adineta ricciae]CAF1478361.1 unnamed protein product [Adineta ricciae]
MIQASTLAFVVLAVVSVSAFTPAQVKFQQETLAHHNQLRARHCVGGLQLDDNLNKIAQAYANKLAAENKFQHSQNGYGENLYYMGSSVSIFEKVAGSKATQAWYDEIKDYNYNQPGFSAKVGHFTQVVWKNSKQLGVGIAYADGGRKALVVANYSPPGNYMGQFPQNVLKAQC